MLHAPPVLWVAPMSGETMRGYGFLACILGALSASACGTSDQARQCSVEENDDGSATITCGDGTSATVASGKDGAEGKLGAEGDSGEAGTQGPQGVQGLSGTDGSSCTLVGQAGGAQVLECSDGTRTVIRPGGILGFGGAPGESRTGSIFYGASSFAVAAENQDPVSFSATGDYAFIEDGTAPYYNYLLAPVRLPFGVQVHQMTCFYFDNTSLGDLDAAAAFTMRPFGAESGIERLRLTMKTTDFVSSQIEMVQAAPPAQLLIDTDAYSYFITVNWFMGDRQSSAVRFYGCRLDYGDPVE